MVKKITSVKDVVVGQKLYYFMSGELCTCIVSHIDVDEEDSEEDIIHCCTEKNWEKYKNSDDMDIFMHSFGFYADANVPQTMRDKMCFSKKDAIENTLHELGREYEEKCAVLRKMLNENDV